jgi:hypothetical protein
MANAPDFTMEATGTETARNTDIRAEPVDRTRGLGKASDKHGNPHGNTAYRAEQVDRTRGLWKASNKHGNRTQHEHTCSSESTGRGDSGRPCRLPDVFGRGPVNVQIAFGGDRRLALRGAGGNGKGGEREAARAFFFAKR